MRTRASPAPSERSLREKFYSGQLCKYIFFFQGMPKEMQSSSFPLVATETEATSCNCFNFRQQNWLTQRASALLKAVNVFAKSSRKTAIPWDWRIFAVIAVFRVYICVCVWWCVCVCVCLSLQFMGTNLGFDSRLVGTFSSPHNCGDLSP